jgi:hypothetical protein
MKLKALLGVLFISFLLPACYSNQQTVGKGIRVEKTEDFTEKNHYLLLGLITVRQVDPITLTKDTLNYTVHTRSTGVDILVTAATVGIYTPTTTTVTIPIEKPKKKRKRRKR